jgi:hypothetical protein
MGFKATTAAISTFTPSVTAVSTTFTDSQAFSAGTGNTAPRIDAGSVSYLITQTGTQTYTAAIRSSGVACTDSNLQLIVQQY